MLAVTIARIAHGGPPMPSPFPGMDPYLEAHWRDVHARLIIYACDALQAVLPSSLRARVEERVLLETPVGYRENVRVIEYMETASERGEALAEPLVVNAEPELITETVLEV